MSVVSIFAGAYCQGQEVARGVADLLGFPLLDDQQLLAETSRRFDTAPAKLARAMFEKPSLFNQFSHERERYASWLKVGVSQMLGLDDMVYLGYGAQLIPAAVSHVLSVCLIGDFKQRVKWVMAADGVNAAEAHARLRREDEKAARWVDYIHGKDAWSADLYDILIPMDKQGAPEAARLIAEHARGVALMPSAASRQALDDFALAAQVEAAIVPHGHNTRDLAVSANRGLITIKVNKHVMLLSRLEEELKRLAGPVEGVSEVVVEPGPSFHQADVYRQADFEMPSKVVLVDDEREFVQTLSERLSMREIGSAVVFDGEQALNLVKEEEPEVIVLDLRMPGIDGIEVLRRLKRDHPLVEVIILTGHGSERDRQVCMQLGAFAYLEKPVDLDQLQQTMRQAYEKIKTRD